jgi:hypothetical protein
VRTFFPFSEFRMASPLALFLCVALKEGEQAMCMINEPQTVMHFHHTTILTPEQFIAGLIDFGPGRSELFANSTDENLKVHYRGLSEADVTEGSGGMGTAVLRLVRSQLRRSHDDRLKCVGLWVQLYLRLQASAKRHNRH